ncbi:hypothetical protein JTB14_031399 [Gonioctena quinquepunctata]|nr:hypothetical protein JTB14_031399 [Gonioctena quinquepunctata]
METSSIQITKTTYIEAMSDISSAGHFDSFKTLSRIKENHYWARMSHDMLNYVESCDVCISQKILCAGRIGSKGSNKTVSFLPKIVAVDIIGPLPRRSKGFTHLLVVGTGLQSSQLMCLFRKLDASNIVHSS